MKILKEGVLPGENWFTGKCINCGCQVEFQRKEAVTCQGEYNSTDYKIDCPTKGCGHSIYGKLIPSSPNKSIYD